MDTISVPANEHHDQFQGDNSEGNVELDDVFGLEDVFFKVENTIFKVPKHGLMYPGSFFTTLFTLPSLGGHKTQMEGADVKHPIPLEGISKSHFKGFLKFLYPLLYQNATASVGVDIHLSTATIRESGNTFDDWVGILRLATMWDFTVPFRKTAIAAISQSISQTGLTAWEKMALAKEFHVKRWLMDEYRNIILGNVDSPQSPLDVSYLLSGGMSPMDIVKIFQIRERRLRTPSRCTKCRRPYGGVSMDSSDIDSEILQEFAEQFIYMEEGEA